ncbi:MAG: homocysteine S-methyltransferase family protein [Thermodesulfobacteriota bacterium]|nr:homocysteine S-methyltransferase family protein [Thermodesulfobacteriota bacterium]
MPDFRQALAKNQIVFFDGAIGTMLQTRGLKPGQSPERFALSHPEALLAVHREYIQAGATVLTTNTFGGTSFKLDDGMDPVSFNRETASLAREAAGDKAFVAGSVGPTGLFAEPLGEMSFRAMVQAFKEQIKGLVAGGVDLILAETQFDLAEARAAVMAAREVCDLPVGASMTFESGVSLTGTPPLTFVDAMQNLGVDLVATNCSAGPEGLWEVVKAMLPRISTPLLVEPNAGLPVLENGRTVFKLGPEAFAEKMKAFVPLGVRCLGGCCGTTPAHIRALVSAVGDFSPVSLTPPEKDCLVLTSRSVSVAVSPYRTGKLIGERINPTGKKRLAQELQAGRFSEAERLATEQIKDGARVLDVNVGAPMVDERKVLPGLVKTLVERVAVPLCLDSTDGDAIRSALNVYPGSALVNSISGEPGRMELLGPLCKRFGAPFILLPLQGKKLPVTAQDRLSIIESLLQKAEDLGIPRRLILVDALVLTVSSKPEAAKACFEVMRHCRDVWNLPTVVGLSNISFGLPARELLNAGFLSMALAHGLSAFIADPGSIRLRETLASSEVLLNRDPQAARFVGGFANWRPGVGPDPSGLPASEKKTESVKDLRQAVILGARDGITAMLDSALDQGQDPFEIVDQELIPAITEVGEKYERKEYFLPQLLLSAETMQRAFEHLKPHLEKKDAQKERVKIIMATVEGDIHDIGKNIVVLMLKNHGFEVIDLGKDVPAEKIVDAAAKAGAKVIGLSALMTTTMVRMEDTVALVRERGLAVKVMVGGAVVTDSFAKAIGANGHAADAVSAVRLAKEMAGQDEGAG